MDSVISVARFKRSIFDGLWVQLLDGVDEFFGKGIDAELFPIVAERSIFFKR